MEHGDSTEGSPKVEQAYRVKLSQAAFRYVAEQLRIVYDRERQAALKDGSFKGLQEFHNSRLSLLMAQVMDQYPDEKTLPEQPVLHVSSEDVAYIDKVIPRPFSAGPGMVHGELIGEFKRNFNEVKRAEQLKGLTQRVKNFIGKRKTP